MALLSVLIPVFNQDVRALADDLEKCLEQVDEKVEVIFADDDSGDELLKKQNSEHISGKEHFKFLIRNKNLGFCENRNELGRDSRGEYLLFLDSDVRITQKDFIQNWLKQLPVKSFLCGGNFYQNAMPSDSTLILKWKHGKAREEAAAFVRNKDPHLRFWASNFLVPRQLFLQVPFDRKSKNYGYNDTVYAYLLMKAGIAVEHIDNPVLNTGLLNNQYFIERIKEAVANLIFFENQPYIQDDFHDFIALLRMEKRFKKLGLRNIMKTVLKNMEDKLLRNLLSNNPKLRNLDLLKLHFLLQNRSE